MDDKNDIDFDRLEKAMSSGDPIRIPHGLTYEEMRNFILENRRNTMTEEKKMARVTIGYARENGEDEHTNEDERSVCSNLTRPGVIATVGNYQSVDGGEVTKIK